MEQPVDIKLDAHLLSLIAHKLRTPLSIINGYSEALQTQSKNSMPPFAIKALQEIGNQGGLLAQLIDKLLSFQKVFETCAEKMTKGNIELKPLLKQEVADALAHLGNRPQPLPEPADTGSRRGTFIDTDCPDGLFVCANEEMLRLALQELLSNAIKFNPRAEKIIKIQCINHGNSISLSVRDYGAGIRPQDVGRIFEPFYQVDDDFTGQVSGWGLGLTMVKRISELHHGTVNVISDRGLGSIFTINLPTL